MARRAPDCCCSILATKKAQDDAEVAQSLQKEQVDAAVAAKQALVDSNSSATDGDDNGGNLQLQIQPAEEK